MDSSMRAEAEKVQLLPALLHIVIYRLYLIVFHQLVLAAGDIDLYKILIYHPAGSKVCVSDFGIAHLPVRQADIFTACVKMSERISCPQAVYERRSLCEDCI